MNSYLIDYYRQQRLCTSVVALTALCASFTTVLMAQPEVTSMPDNAAKRGGDGGNFTNTTFNSAATAINDNHAIQTIGPPKTARMVRTKWTSLKKIFNQIENYRNVSGFHWDNVRGAGIEGRAAGDVWDTYVNPNSRAVMRPFRNKGWARYDNMQLIVGDNSGARGRHALHPATAPPPSVNTADDVPDVFDGGLGLLDMDVDTAGAAAPSDVPDMSPDLMMPLSAQLHGTSATSQAAGSQSSKCMRTDTFVDSSSQRTGAPPVSNNPVPLSSMLISLPAPKKARVSAHGGMQSGINSAAKIAAKITPAVAVMNMQGSINRLTDVIEKTIATPPPLPPPVPQVVVPTVPNIISRGLEIMRSKDGDFLSVGQRASLLRIFSLAGGDNKLAIYVGLEDDYETRRAFILELLDSPLLQ
ncbi:hypothetical protein DFJ58DRAFT_724961 [Suillus subalutaceus]|uniref:uncharacterized protein n=1 Tax=Suillus subalutaceus TaxID=48586 RepID=UPI001B87407F|nr:uncharacterized protein DFJ58DRAFT_724961 [Suillus subalutaceus]KAG1863544.1 hypothetical protein DFJ58DRAFT_724961 [Suillus subalutaceus]